MAENIKPRSEFGKMTDQVASNEALLSRLNKARGRTYSDVASVGVLQSISTNWMPGGWPELPRIAAGGRTNGNSVGEIMRPKHTENQAGRADEKKVARGGRVSFKEEALRVTYAPGSALHNVGVGAALMPVAQLADGYTRLASDKYQTSKRELLDDARKRMSRAEYAEFAVKVHQEERLLDDTTGLLRKPAKSVAGDTNVTGVLSAKTTSMSVSRLQTLINESDTSQAGLKSLIHSMKNVTFEVQQKNLEIAKLKAQLEKAWQRATQHRREKKAEKRAALLAPKAPLLELAVDVEQKILEQRSKWDHELATQKKMVAELQREVQSLKKAEKDDKKLKNSIRMLTTERDDAVSKLTTSEERLRAEKVKVNAKSALVAALQQRIETAEAQKDAFAKAHQDEKATMEAEHYKALAAVKDELLETMRSDYESALNLQVMANKNGWRAFQKKHFQDKEVV